MGGVQVIQGLHEADAADLEEVINIFAAGGEALDDGEDEAEVALEEFIAGGLIAGMDEGEKLTHTFGGDDGEFRGIDAAEIDFAVGHGYTS